MLFLSISNLYSVKRRVAFPFDDNETLQVAKLLAEFFQNRSVDCLVGKTDSGIAVFFTKARHREHKFGVLVPALDGASYARRVFPLGRLNCVGLVRGPSVSLRTERTQSNVPRAHFGY